MRICLSKLSVRSPLAGVASGLSLATPLSLSCNLDRKLNSHVLEVPRDESNENIYIFLRVRRRQMNQRENGENWRMNKWRHVGGFCCARQRKTKIAKISCDKRSDIRLQSCVRILNVDLIINNNQNVFTRRVSLAPASLALEIGCQPSAASRCQSEKIELLVVEWQETRAKIE